MALRIDQALKPAGLMKSAVAYSLFIADGGVYAIRTGSGWRSNVRASYRNDAGPEQASATAAALDPSDLPGELAARTGSLFIPATDLVEVELSRFGESSLTLHFTGGSKSHRFQFDVERLAEVEAFIGGLARLAVTGASGGAESSTPGRSQSPGAPLQRGVETIALPSPCWGATPHVSVADGRLYVEHLAPTDKQHGEKLVVYRSTDEEQVKFVSGRLDLLVLCQRLVGAAWGIKPAAGPVDQFAAPVRARVTSEPSTLKHALALCAGLLEESQRNLGRGGSAEQIARWEQMLDLEIDRAEIQRKLHAATGRDD